MAAHKVHVNLPRRLLVIGFGCVGQGLLPLLLRHIGMAPGAITIVSADRSLAVQERQGFLIFRAQVLSTTYDGSVVRSLPAFAGAAPSPGKTGSGKELLDRACVSLMRLFFREFVMSSRSIPPGFHPARRDRLLQEAEHDSYKTRGKLPDPTICTHCGAVFRGGRWQWGVMAPMDAHRASCPACQRAHDHYPAGFVFLEGDFLLAHRDEIGHLIRNEAERQRAEHPLKRVMAIDESETGLRVSTTDIHLARAIGEAVHHAYQGELEFHYNPEEALLRVHWSR